MKNYILFLLVIAALAFGGAATASAQGCDPNFDGSANCNYYNAGYRLGVNDATGNQSSDYKRHRSSYSRNFETYFRNGYQAGYSSVDRRGGGWNNGGRGNGGWNNGGGNSGTATWSGRVDDRANIIISGRSIRAEDVTGSGLQIYTQDMNGSLGNRDASVTAVKRSGRGNVSVIQQPSRYNNYTAIIQVSDTKGGADNYQIDIAWNGGGGNVNNGGWNGRNENYRSGRVTWRGRVDQTVNIRIDGANVYSEDDSGTGLSDVSFDINGALAHRQGSVNVRKRNGRGSVFVLQQPSYENGFTAVIQISDTGSGADNYELEITW